MSAVLIGRRELLRRAAALGLIAPFAGLPLAAAEVDLVARRLFFDNPDYGDVRISPDGEHLAYLAPLDGVRNLWVAPISDPHAGRPLIRRLSGFFLWAHTNRHIVFFRDHDGDENWRAASIDIDTGAIVPLSPEQGVRAFVQETDRKFPDEILLRHNQRDKRLFDLFRINVATGASELIYENHDYFGLVTDSAFRLRLGTRFAKDGSGEWFERHEDGTWAPFTTVPIGDTDGTRPLGFSADGKTLYMLDTRGRDRAALFAVDVATRESRVLAEDDEADIVGVTFSGRRPLAAAAVKERVRWHAITPEIADDLSLLAAYHPGDIAFTSRSYGNRKVVVHFNRDTASGEFALLDRIGRTVQPLYTDRKALAQVALRAMTPVTFPARDGLTLNGYLTLPEADASGLPLILLVHGGPYARDLWGYSAAHQFLANRGYATLSVNYRSSTGFGKAFVTAADHEWGGRMHDDLIDAVDWAIAKGIADPKRVGFVGASYGGYSALMAATKTPEYFACIVDVFGVSNLLTFMKTIPPYWGPWFSIWKNRLGDPDTEAGRAFLAERSPLNHGFVRPENRLAFDAVTEAFLAKHLGGRYQPIGDDFSGSTIKIETGGELVPGLAG
jgi:dipeptidyl aminopeptidase/acylaminoacyl peptidase